MALALGCADPAAGALPPVTQGHETVSNFANARSWDDTIFIQIPHCRAMPVRGSNVVFESPGMPKKIVDEAAEAGRRQQTENPHRLAWVSPALVKLEPGSAGHARAKAAFDLAKRAGRAAACDPE